MSLYGFFTYLQNSAVGHSIRKADILVGATLQVLHVAGFVLLLAAVALVNLRLLGVGLRSQPIAQVARASAKILWLGAVLAVLSGTLIFMSAAVHYYPNEAFWSKMALLVLAIAFQLTIHRKVVAGGAPSRAVATAVALVSLTLWFGVGIAGRAIGFI